jgi:predicted ATP-dependent endonuclease of OLD family
MISAIFLKSFKIYRNIKFISLTNSNCFTALIGQNGTGKSSVLEALNSYFNNHEWNINKQARSAGGIVYINTPYVAPVFLILKSELKQSTQLMKSYVSLIQIVSDYLWSIERKGISSSTQEINEFIKYRDELKEEIDHSKYYLVIAGKRFEQQNKIYFGPFHHQDTFLKSIGYNEIELDNKAEQYLQEDSYIQDKFKGLVDYIQQHYSYVYIPSDIDVKDYTKLETDDMQKLMDKSIKDIIQDTIKQTSLDSINKSLNTFIEEISKKLDSYTYRKPTGGKASITMPDLVSTIIREYFSIRFLTKKISGEYIPVNNLSSGEKRKSLIDLSYAFLSQAERKETIILAIDEPEISLHVSSCFDQFEKLYRLSENRNQIILTTHWYGFLPAMQSGTAVFLNIEDDKVISEKYDLGNYREKIIQTIRKEKGKLPYDVFLKSNYDLVQSIILSIRKPNSYKWILCEGSSEKIYFSHFFKKEIEDGYLRILPLGGCGEIVRIYEYLQVGIEEKDGAISGKILALIDTDEQLNKFKPLKTIKCLSFKRLYFKDGKVSLIDIDASDVANTTEIEDALSAKLFCEVLSNIGTSEIKRIISDNGIQPDAIWSYDAMDLKPSQEKKIKEYFDSEDGNKIKFALAYVKSPNFNPKKEPLYSEVLNYLK